MTVYQRNSMAILKLCRQNKVPVNIHDQSRIITVSVELDGRTYDTSFDRYPGHLMGTRMGEVYGKLCRFLAKYRSVHPLVPDQKMAP
jgi:hypothetical protein